MDRIQGPLTDITVRTHTPSKWLFVDTETREVWKWVDGGWKWADPAGLPDFKEEEYNQ